MRARQASQRFETKNPSTHTHSATDASSGEVVVTQTVMRAASDAARTYNFTTAGAWSGTVDAQGGSTAYVRDADRALLRVTDPLGRTTSFVYDANRNVIAITNALGQATTFAFDAVGNRTSQTDPAGMTTQWTYDSLNHVTSVSSGTLTYEYDYNAASQRTAMRTKVNGAVTETTTYEYDDRGRLIRKTDPSGYVLTYGYDSVGNRTSLTVGQASLPAILQMSYTYDTRNRVSSIAGNGKTTSFSYDAAGRRIAAAWPNGTTASYSYDDANQLLSVVHGRAGSPSQPLASFAYQYNLDGNRTQMTTLEGNHTYTYDERHWLTGVTYPDGRTQSFTYDDVGNRISLSDSGGASASYTYNAANQLVSSTGASYTYDGAGRLSNQVVNSRTRSYQYNFRSQMTAMTDTNGTTFAYDFDGDGNRIRQSRAGCLTSRYVYDGNNCVLELNASNQVVHAYVNAGVIDQLVGRIGFINGEARKREVYHTDGLGSVVAVTDESQSTAKSYTYEAFGRIRSETGNTIDRYTFTTRESLGDTLGFMYYRNRVYDPNVGRFTSEDPQGFTDGPNLYLYVGNNPINKVDPEGLFDWDTVKSAFTVYYGMGLGFGAKGKVGPVKVGFHLGLANEHSINTKEGASTKATAAAEAFLAAGKYKAKIGPSYEKVTEKHGEALNNPEVKRSSWNPAIEREVGKATVAASPWSVGVAAQPGLGNVGVNVDLKTLWEGLTSRGTEAPSPKVNGSCVE